MSKNIFNWNKLAQIAVTLTFAGGTFLYLAQFVEVPAQVKEHEKRLNQIESFELIETNQFNNIVQRLDWQSEAIRQLQSVRPNSDDQKQATILTMRGTNQLDP